MGELTHKAARAAFGGAIDLAMRKMDKDREKGLLDLVDLTERFMGDNFQKSSYEGARKMIQDPDSKWMSYVNRALDEIDPHILPPSIRYNEDYMHLSDPSGSATEYCTDVPLSYCGLSSFHGTPLQIQGLMLSV